MKFIITGSLGNISKPLTQLLIEKGHDVTVISNDGQKVGKIEALGARAAIGSVQDPNFFLTLGLSGRWALWAATTERKQSW